MTQELIKGTEAARMLGLAKSTLYDWSRRGILPSVVLHQGEHRAVRRWRQADLERFIATRSTNDETRRS